MICLASHQSVCFEWPTMRFVAIKSREQQAALSLHRARDLMVKQRTQLVNMIRGLLAEFGIDIPKGLERAVLMAQRIAEGGLPLQPVLRQTQCHDGAVLAPLVFHDPAELGLDAKCE